MHSVTEFLETQPDLKPFIVETQEGSKWGRMVCEWHESATDYTHIYIPLINLETGDFYSDCSRKKIYVKLLVHTITRPLYIFTKTLFHAAFFVSIPVTIVRTIIDGNNEELKRKEIIKKCWRNSFRSLADCVRTPLYGVALIILGIATLMIAPFNKNSIYTLREMTAKVIQSLYWNEEDEYHQDYFRCLLPLANLYDQNYYKKQHQDTDYAPEASDYEIGLNNLARGHIKHLRDNCIIFNTPWYLNPNTEFLSPIYSEVEEAIG